MPSRWNDATFAVGGVAFGAWVCWDTATAAKVAGILSNYQSGGEYYTPQEVSELLARITVVGKDEVNKVYDPACGSGSLLLKFAKVLGPGKVRQGLSLIHISEPTRPY